MAAGCTTVICYITTRYFFGGGEQHFTYDVSPTLD